MTENRYPLIEAVEDGNDGDTSEDEQLPSRPMPLVPPLSFAMVCPGVYRSGHPLQINFPMLAKLKLKTIVYLADQDYAPENVAWCAENGVRVHHFRVKPVREPLLDNNPEAIEEALRIVTDQKSHPILLHSNKGKHRVGVLVGCMRRLIHGWSLAAVNLEYGRFAGEKGDADLEFMELFCASAEVVS